MRATCAKASWTEFQQSDFEKGTIRIKKSGCYRLKESILFEPLGGCCDYWPRFRTSNEAEYPMGPYALGFFAAITIEADNVVLDLNGYTIEASLEFSLKQRFFNVIQFSSRVFEAHDGMDALNLQVGTLTFVTIQIQIYDLTLPSQLSNTEWRTFGRPRPEPG